MKNHFKPLGQTILLLLLVFIMLTVCRLGFLIYNFGSVADVPSGEIAKSFFIGLRFDGIAAAYVAGLPILISALFIQFRGFKMGFIYPLWILALLGLIIPNFIDIGYFPFSGRRTGKEFLETFGEAPNMVLSYVVTYWLLSIFAILFILMAFWGIKKRLSALSKSLSNSSKIARFLPIFILLPLLVLMARGGFQLRPLRAIDAPRFIDSRLTSLTINTQVQLISTLGAEELPKGNLIDNDLAFKIVAGETKFVPSQSNNRPNVVLIIVESLAKEHVGYFYQDKPSFTPFLDSLIKHSIVFNNAFANGRRSIDAVPSILAGIPDWMAEPFISSFYQNNQFETVGSQLKKLGYDCSFYHGANNQTMNFSGFLAQGNFGNYNGLNQYPEPKRDFDGQWGIFDDAYLSYMAAEFDLKTKKSPVFQAVFTLSSHLPYTIPEKLKNRFPKGKQAIQQSIAYADYSLQQYFNQIKQSEAYSNTWFIITADHTAELYRKEYMHIFDYFKIPIVAFHPNLTKHQLIEKPVQQLDILPTILSQANFYESFFSLGINLLDCNNNKSRMILIQNQGTFYGMLNSMVVQFVEPDQFQFFEMKNDNMQPANFDFETQQLLKQQILSNLQVYRNKMRSGKW